MHERYQKLRFSCDNAMINILPLQQLLYNQTGTALGDTAWCLSSSSVYPCGKVIATYLRVHPHKSTFKDS